MIGKLLLMAAIVLVAVGAIVALQDKVPSFKLGRLPGDIIVQKDGNTLFIPITSILVVSLVLTLIFSLLRIF